MPMLPATVTSAPQGQVKPAPAQRAGAIAFSRAAQRHTEQGNVVSGIALNVTAPGTFNFAIPSYGYLAGVFLTFSATGGAGAGVFYEDAPWSAISNIMLQDVNGTPIFGPFDGYSAHLASQLGGYRDYPGNPLITATDTTVAPAPFGQVIQYGPSTPTATGNTPLYYATTTGGNWNSILPIWLQFGQGGLGSLPNMDASSRYNLQVTLGSGLTGTNGPIYTTQPATTVPSLTLAVEAYCVAQPLAADIYGQQNMTEPPANGTIQYWSRQTFASLSGAQTIQLARIGNVIRNHILVMRDATTNTRATAETSDMPPVIQFDWDSQPRYIEFLGTSRFKANQVSGLNAPAGVVIYENTSDPENTTGAERGDFWMTTVGATKLVLRFTPAATVNLQVLTNDFVPSSGEIYSAA
jgi:hypothetical protein